MSQKYFQYYQPEFIVTIYLCSQQCDALYTTTYFVLKVIPKSPWIFDPKRIMDENTFIYLRMLIFANEIIRFYAAF